MEFAVYAYDVEHVVLDNLNFMMSGQGRGYDKFDAQERALDRFRKFATHNNVHLTLVIHPRCGCTAAPAPQSRAATALTPLSAGRCAARSPRTPRSA